MNKKNTNDFCYFKRADLKKIFPQNDFELTIFVILANIKYKLLLIVNNCFEIVLIFFLKYI